MQPPAGPTAGSRVPTVLAASRPGGSEQQVEVLQQLRGGDRAAFAALVDSWSPALLRVALLHVSTRASAEEIVQETWLAVITQLDRFQGRSSVKTWVFRILENQARTRGVREARSLPWSTAFPGRRQFDDDSSTVDPRRLRGPDGRRSGGWTVTGRAAAGQPDPGDAAVAAELRRQLATAMTGLPQRQRAVVELRDVHGLSAAEVCARLALSPANQRVLLHRGRARLRARLEDVYRERGAGR